MASLGILQIGGLMAIAACLLMCSSARAQTVPVTTIESPGPVKQLFVGADLSCQVSYGDPSYEFYPPGTAPGDCGTFVSVDGVLYAPDFRSHRTTATSGLGGRTVFTRGSRSGVSGSGTSADPFVVEIVARAGTALELRQRTSYASGSSIYRVDITVTNLRGEGRSVRLFHAGDCYASGSDIGYGFTRTEIGAVGCSQNVDNSPPARTIQLSPLSSGSSFFEARYDQVWSQLGALGRLPDICRCSESIDNGVGLSWGMDLPGDGSTTRSLTVGFTESQRAAPPPDSDGDALPDAWEIGASSTADAENLAPIGADPGRRDIFVHADWMQGCAPPAGWERRLISVFAARGVALHVDSGPQSLNADGTPWGSRSRAGEVSFADNLLLDTSWASFDRYKDTHFVPSNRRRAFHYVLFASAINGEQAGLARGIPDADFVIANCSSAPRSDDAYFLHELGHNLGLRHGGADSVNHKTNYFSIMNYSWALRNIGRGELTDYSTSRRSDLDEHRVDERAGIQTPAIWHCRTGTAADGSPAYSPRPITRAGFRSDPDFDCDGVTREAPPYAANLNADVTNAPNGQLVGALSTLVGQNDWAEGVIQYGGAGVIGALDLPARPNAPVEPELTRQEVESTKAASDALERRLVQRLLVRTSTRRLPRGRRIRSVRVQVLAGGRPVRRASVRLRGGRLTGGRRSVRTDRRGRAHLRLRVSSRRELRIYAERRGLLRGGVVVPVVRR